jgi:cytochrome b pre-mRNA-processing protein 3
LLELTIDDMDQALREMGVGDMGVSRRIKQMGNAMNGRFHAYAAGLAEGTLADALARNAYGTVTPEAISPEAVELLQDYTLRMVAHLQAQAAEKIDLSGLLMPDIIKA